MKNLIGFCLICLVATNSFAQKCKESVDPITSEKKTEFLNISGNGFGNLMYEIKNGSATLTKEFVYAGMINIISPAGTELFFKLENGEILKLKTVKEVSPKMYAGYGVTTGYTYQLGLTKDDLNKLAASPVMLIRIPKVNEAGYIDLEKKNYYVKKSKGPLMKGAACIVTLL